MSTFEKKASITLLLAALILFGIRVKADYSEKTKIVPKSGGIYREAVVGEFKYFNPILASTDAEKSISKLIFSGLIKIDKDNNVLPDLAEKWEVSPDGLKYTFYLRNDAYFHDSQKVSAEDVVQTIEKIKNPNLNSPIRDAWSDVTVQSDGEKVIFDLPRAYGSFIYNCDFGILPTYLSDQEFNKKIIGSGPYKFLNSFDKGGQITQINLAKNDNYFDGDPFISKIEFDFYKTFDEASKEFQTNNKVNALSVEKIESPNIGNYNFATTKQLGLIFNLRIDKLKDKKTRQAILNGDKLPDQLILTLSTLDNDLQREKAEEIKNKLQNQNILLDIKHYDPIEMQDILAKRDYELLLFGFDFGHDRDPYVFWHSSQADKLNFAGFSDKNSDILLEDARMLADNKERNAKYDQFYGTIKSEALGEFYEPVKSYLNVKSEIKGVSLNCNDPKYKFSNIKDWYIKEKRVRK